jgi:hypothetical protein
MVVPLSPAALAARTSAVPNAGPPCGPSYGSTSTTRPCQPTTCTRGVPSWPWTPGTWRRPGLLCGSAGPRDVSLIKVIGLLCFADRAAVEVLAKIPGAARDLVWLADRSRRSARITAVRALAGHSDPVVREWVLLPRWESAQAEHALWLGDVLRSRVRPDPGHRWRPARGGYRVLAGRSHDDIRRSGLIEVRCSSN